MPQACSYVADTGSVRTAIVLSLQASETVFCFTFISSLCKTVRTQIPVFLLFHVPFQLTREGGGTLLLCRRLSAYSVPCRTVQKFPDEKLGQYTERIDRMQILYLRFVLN